MKKLKDLKNWRIVGNMAVETLPDGKERRYVAFSVYPLNDSSNPETEIVEIAGLAVP